MRTTFSQLLFAVATLGLLFGSTRIRAQDDKLEKELSVRFPFKAVKVEAGDDELRRLLKERYNAAVGELHDRTKEFLAGRGTLEYLFDAHRRLTRAGLEVYEKPADRVALLQKNLDQAKEVEKVNQARFDAGRIASQDLHRSRYFRLDAEIELLRARRAAGKK